MKNKTILLVLFCLICGLYSQAQFTGGIGSGYCSAVSTTQQLNDTIFNDLAVSQINNPSTASLIPVNTVSALQFTMLNNGTYTVQITDSVYFSVDPGYGAPLSYTLAPSSPVAPGASHVFTLTDVLSYQDTGLTTLCVTVNGSSWASDSVSGNNTACVQFTVNDPSGIEESSVPEAKVYFDNTGGYIVIEFNNKPVPFVLYGLNGAIIPCRTETEGNRKIVKPYRNFPELVFVQLQSTKPLTVKILTH